MSRAFAIGDIHGRYDELMRVLDYLEYKDSDRLILLGDYIDRGNQSKEVMDFLVEIKKNKENVFLKGNHEDMFLKLSMGNSSLWSTWLEDGEGRKCLRSYGVDPDYFQKRGDYYFFIEGEHKISMGSPNETVRFFLDTFPKEHMEIIRDSLLFYEEGDFFFSHAGAVKSFELSKQPEWALVWGDDTFDYDSKDYGKTIVYGHYHRKSPYIGYRKIGMALYNGVGALDLNDMVIVDSEGNFTEVRPEQLMLNLYRDYMPMPGLWR